MVTTLSFKLCRGGDGEIILGKVLIEHRLFSSFSMCPLKGHLSFGGINPGCTGFLTKLLIY